MKTIAIALCALCIGAMPAMAGDWEVSDKLLEITSLNPHVATCTDSERLCMQGGWTYTDVDFYGLSADSSVLDGSVAIKVPGWDRAQVNLSIATGTDDFFENTAIRAGFRLGFGHVGVDYAALK